MGTPGAGPVNRLAQAASPYLLLHQHNPVDWYPWGEEALAKARAEDKPIFLSVGYSTCYWCHVMERESFSNPETASLMNDHFVNIKLDREERPDLDEIYMAATQILAGQGGWPNSVFLTPDLKPFYAGTYFPPERRHNIPAFREILNGMHHAWNHRRSEVQMQADELDTAMRRFLEQRGAPGEIPSASVAGRAVSALAARFDESHGGFGGAPKFPSPGNLYLLDALADEDTEADRMLTATLDRMARGGLYDQFGGGFHRYATDAAWKVPHFEKMLYDNGHLLRLYARAHARSGEPESARVVRETAAFLEREMRLDHGGFASALDAEMDGFEGGYYVWTMAQLRATLGVENTGFLAAIYGWDGPPFFEGEYYIPYLPSPLSVQAERRRLSREDLLAQIAPLRARLMAARDRRKRPLLDDKVLADWNGMVIAGLAEAGRALEDPALIAAGERAADFVLETMWPAGEPLLHSWRDGRPGPAAFLADYAFLLDGLLALRVATGEARWLEAAVRLADEMIARLGDQKGGGFFTAAAADDVLMRSKEVFDGALPAANAVAILALQQLHEITADSRWLAQADAAWRAFGGMVEQQPDATRMLAVAVRDRRRIAARTPTASADVVRSSFARQDQDGEGWSTFRLRLEIAPGWHLYGEGVTAEHGLAATIEAESVTLRDVEWPASQPLTLQGDSSNVPVYEGTIEIAGQLRCAEGVLEGQGGHTEREDGDRGAIVVRFQACDDRRCLAPSERRIAVCG